MHKWQQADTLLLWVVIILGVMIFLVVSLLTVFYISHKKIIAAKENEIRTKLKYQRSLLRVSLQAQENERKRIATNLHDNIISKLTVIRLKNAVGIKGKEIDDLLGKAIDESRRISHDLLPPFVEEKTIDNLLVTVFKNWKMFYVLKQHIDIRDVTDVNKNVKLQLVRILQELLNNIHKHAHATEIYLHIRITVNYFVMTVTDNGKGFDVNTKKNGIGLKNISLRAQNLKAKYKYKSLTEKGTRFIFFVNHGENKTSNSR
jgi:two-component system NarL family sensor kinase